MDLVRTAAGVYTLAYRGGDGSLNGFFPIRDY